MKVASCFPSLRVACALLLATGLAACERPATPSVQSSPAPTPAQTTTAEKADRAKEKTHEAASATGDYLKDKAQQLGVNLRDLSAKLDKEKDVWRQKLEQKQKDLQPQIDDLKRRAATANEQMKPELNRQLINLEAQRQRLGERLHQMQSASADAWETFKAKMKEEDEKTDAQPTPERK